MTDAQLHSLEPGIGEAAERERLRQVRRIRDFLIIGLVIAVAGLPFTAGLFNGLTGGPAAEPRWVHAAPAALSTLIAAVGGWLGWRRADELKRRRAINTIAIFGAIILFGAPLVFSWNAAFDNQIDLTLAFFGALLVLLVVATYQHWRA